MDLDSAWKEFTPNPLDQSTKDPRPSLAFLVIGMLLLLLGTQVSADDSQRAPSLVMLDGQAYHDITGLPIDLKGWTDFDAMLSSPSYAGARIVFVSKNEGNDSTAQVYGVGDISFDENGMFQPRGSIQPYETIAAAYSEIRENAPDIILLERGNEWAEAFDRNGAGRIKSGASAQARHIVASYGAGDRPRLFGAQIDARDASYTIVSGLHLYDNDWRVSGRALDITGAVNHQLYEDMRFDKKNEDKIQGGSSGISNVAIRRSFYSHYQAHDGFVYIARVKGMLLEENVYFEPWQKNLPDESRHGRHLYLSPSGLGDDKNALVDVISRGNIFYRGERVGVDARGGGHWTNNLMLQNDRVRVGGSGGSRGSIQSSFWHANVFMQGPPNSGGSVDNVNGIEFLNIDTGSLTNNIWTDSRGLITANAISLAGSGTVEEFPQQVLKNVTIAHNIIYDFADAKGGGRAIDLSAGLTEIENVTITANAWQYLSGSDELVRHRDWTGGMGDRFQGFSYSGNKYFSTNDSFMPGNNFAGWLEASGETDPRPFGPIDYPQPGRTIDDYMSVLGLSGGAVEFMALSLEQSRHNWDPAFTAPAVNAYIREGFGVVLDIDMR